MEFRKDESLHAGWERKDAGRMESMKDIYPVEELDDDEIEEYDEMETAGTGTGSADENILQAFIYGLKPYYKGLAVVAVAAAIFCFICNATDAKANAQTGTGTGATVETTTAQAYRFERVDYGQGVEILTDYATGNSWLIIDKTIVQPLETAQDESGETND